MNLFDLFTVLVGSLSSAFMTKDVLFRRFNCFVLLSGFGQYLFLRSTYFWCRLYFILWMTVSRCVMCCREDFVMMRMLSNGESFFELLIDTSGFLFPRWVTHTLCLQYLHVCLNIFKVAPHTNSKNVDSNLKNLMYILVLWIQYSLRKIQLRPKTVKNLNVPGRTVSHFQ